jgi:glycine cleavage system regulatory protein
MNRLLFTAVASTFLLTGCGPSPASTCAKLESFVAGSGGSLCEARLSIMKDEKPEKWKAFSTCIADAKDNDSYNKCVAASK